MLDILSQHLWSSVYDFIYKSLFGALQVVLSLSNVVICCYVEDHSASSLVCWKNGDVLISAEGCHCLPFLQCEVRGRSFRAKDGCCYLHMQLFLFLHQRFWHSLFQIQQLVMRSTTGSCCEKMAKLSPLAKTFFSGWVRSLSVTFFNQWSRMSMSIVSSCPCLTDTEVIRKALALSCWVWNFNFF